MKESICKRCEHSRYCGASIIDKELTVMTGCSRFEERKPQTNADRIRAMSDEALAGWIAKILDHCENKMPDELCRMSCPLYKCCNDQPSDNIEDWLKSPAEGEG